MIYQKHFSKINKSMLDKKMRTYKAKKVVAVIEDFLKKKRKPFKNLLCLDIGGSTGFVAKELSPIATKVYVVDIDKDALKFGKKNNNANNIFYKTGDAMNLPLRDKSVDIVICNQVYEHVPNYFKLVREIRRILTNDGLCYFGAANRFILVEPHYNLPFLSWLPKKIANIYLKLAKGKKEYYENLLSYKDLKRLLKDFVITDYSANIIKNPEKFYASDMIGNNNIISKLPDFILTILTPFFPGYVFVLTKKLT